VIRNGSPPQKKREQAPESDLATAVDHAAPKSSRSAAAYNYNYTCGNHDA